MFKEQKNSAILEKKMTSWQDIFQNETSKLLGREDKIKNVENDIEGMIDSLVEVVGTITNDTKTKHRWNK